MQLPVLLLCGTKDGSDAADRYRTLLLDCHLMFVYDAGRAIGAERPEALATSRPNSSSGGTSSSSAGKRHGVSLGSEAENSRASSPRRKRSLWLASVEISLLAQA
jgi:hypothetical protein